MPTGAKFRVNYKTCFRLLNYGYSVALDKNKKTIDSIAMESERVQERLALFMKEECGRAMRS